MCRTRDWTISFTMCPNPCSFLAQWWALPHASIPTRHGSSLAKNDAILSPLTCSFKPVLPPHTCRRYLGNYQHLPKLRFEREETDLDTRSGATAIAGLDPLAFPRTTRSQGVTWYFALAVRPGHLQPRFHSRNAWASPEMKPLSCWTRPSPMMHNSNCSSQEWKL